MQLRDILTTAAVLIVWFVLNRYVMPKTGAGG